MVSNYGISKDDERIIGKADGIKEVEYGYFKDVVISGTDRSMRIYSKPDAVSTYDVTEGRLPKRTGEIALDMKERDRFAVGSTLNVTEKTDIAGGTVLRHHKFTVVGSSGPARLCPASTWDNPRPAAASSKAMPWPFRESSIPT